MHKHKPLNLRPLLLACLPLLASCAPKQQSLPDAAKHTADLAATVRSKITDARMLANIPVANTIRGNPVYNLRDVGPALFGSPASADPDDIHDPSKMSPKDRKDWFQSENERVKLEVSARQLVHGDEVREQLSCIVKAVTEVLDTWPDKLERDKGRSVAQINEAQSMVDELRDTLADEVKEIMPADASAHLYRIQNLSKTETLWFNDTGAEAAADTPGSYVLAPGEYYEFSSTHAVSVYATTAIEFSAARY